MQRKSIPRDEIIPFFRKACEEYGLSESSQSDHIRTLRHLYNYLEDGGISDYTEDIGLRFVEESFSDPSLSRPTQNRRRAAVNLLNNALSGKPFSELKRHERVWNFQGDVGQEVLAFIDRLSENRPSPQTIYNYKHVLEPFVERLRLDGVTLNTLNEDEVMGFVSSVQNQKPDCLYIFRNFLTFLYERGSVKQDFAEMFRHIRLPHKDKLPSFYTPAEVKQVEDSIDRANALGKRAYAIILLASRLGLRSSDIRFLRFENLDWESNVIRLLQYKTKREVELPLLADVGQAIIDYVTNGRPQSNLKFVFTTHHTPYRVLNQCSLSTLVRDIIAKSGVDKRGRHAGPHTLRHSLATTMLHNATGLPVISASLGHSTTESTKVYLNVDIPCLLECSLMVPPVENGFYNQKGGLLYD